MNNLSFRIWDKALSKWVEEYQCGTHAMTETYISLDGSVTKFSAGFPDRDEEPLWSKDDTGLYFHGGEWWKNEERYVVQRGTGMNDIEEKEIYEGDLVELHQAIQPTGFGLYEVFYKRASFQLKEIKPNWAINFMNPYLSDYNICKVVGNIFENPDLIA
jgi:uncharacterized phage protein (TIGR01671 family)